MRCANSCRRLDISLPKAGALRPAQFNRILARVKGRDVEKLVNEVVLRTQAQAEYAAENYGHFGLNLRRYAHFTSPIRRYADLDRASRADPRAQARRRRPAGARRTCASLGEIAARISAAERRAMKAERETFDRLIAHFLADRIGATFEGHISGVTRAGLFVKLDETGADGFIPARTIGGEYFRYHEDRHALVGDRSGADPPARRSGDGAAGRGGAGRRRAALRAAVGGRPGRDCGRRAAPTKRPARRPRAARDRRARQETAAMKRDARRPHRADDPLRGADERGRARSHARPMCGRRTPRR